MFHRLFVVFALLLSMSGCSFSSSDPANCDVQSSPDSKACIKKQANLDAACIAASTQDSLVRCDEADLLKKSRLTRRFVHELGCWNITDRQILAIAEQAEANNLSQVTLVIYRDHFRALRDAVQTKKCQPELDHLVSDLGAVTTFSEALERGYGTPLQYVGIACDNRDEVSKATDTRALALLDAAIKDLKTYGDAQRLLGDITRWTNSESGLMYGMWSDLQTRKMAIVIIMLRSAKAAGMM